ncbi:MAG: GNAT family N-acetyltransferase [Candidatus Thorarchaeota archaeon]
MITYRRAIPEDINKLVELRVEFLYEAEEITEDTPSEELRNSLYDFFQRNMKSEQFISWIAVQEDEIVATSGLVFYEIPPLFENISGKEAYLMNMYTIPNLRRKGMGTKLLKKLIEEARKRSIRKVRLMTTASGKHLYEKNGFKYNENEMYLLLD